MKKLAAVLLGLTFAISLSTCADRSGSADFILLNGQVYTMEDWMAANGCSGG